MFEVVNYSWTVNDVSHVSRVWHADAQTASDTTGAVNSPDSTSLLLSHLRISCDTRAVECLKAIFWQWRLFKTPGNLKKKMCWLFQSSMLQYRQRPQGGRHPKDRREFREVATEHLCEVLWVCTGGEIRAPRCQRQCRNMARICIPFRLKNL